VYGSAFCAAYVLMTVQSFEAQLTCLLGYIIHACLKLLIQAVALCLHCSKALC